MTNQNPLGTLTQLDAEACCGDGCCDGDSSSSEITHDQLDSISAAVQHRYGRVAESAADRAADPSRRGASDIYYTENQRAVITTEAEGASAGCGNPVGIADAKPGETVLDLGSGGGIDCFLAAREVGEKGHVIGIDMTPRMIRGGPADHECRIQTRPYRIDTTAGQHGRPGHFQLRDRAF